MGRYTPHGEADRAAMLETIGVESAERLFEIVPERYLLAEGCELPSGLAEQEVFEHLRELAARKVSLEDEVSFLGAGMYDHYVPALVEAICQRSEFLTPYTPYPPEVSQGTLQVMFEYQTAISELTGLPVSNGTLYDGASAVGAAAYMLKLAGPKRRLLVSRGLHPHARETLRTLSKGFGTAVEEVPLSEGATDGEALAGALGDDVAGLFVAQPNFQGAVEDLAGLAAVKGDGALVVCADPITLGILRAPGEQGAEICVGEGSRSETTQASGVPRSGSSPRPRSTCAACPDASQARPAIATVAAGS